MLLIESYIQRTNFAKNFQMSLLDNINAHTHLHFQVLTLWGQFLALTPRSFQILFNITSKFWVNTGMVPKKKCTFK